VSTARRVRIDDLGAWLLRANPRTGDVVEHLAEGLRNATTRCVRSSYRTDLVRPGQRVLLWVSGGSRELPPGIHGHW